MVNKKKTLPDGLRVPSPWVDPVITSTVERSIERLTEEVRALRRDLELELHPLALSRDELRRWVPLARRLDDWHKQEGKRDLSEFIYECRMGYFAYIDLGEGVK